MKTNKKNCVYGIAFLMLINFNTACSNDIKHYNTTQLLDKLNSKNSEEVINILGKPDDVVQMVDYKIYRYISDDDRVFFEKDESGKDENLYVRISYDGYVISVGN